MIGRQTRLHMPRRVCTHRCRVTRSETSHRERIPAGGGWGWAHAGPVMDDGAVRLIRVRDGQHGPSESGHSERQSSGPRLCKAEMPGQRAP